VKNAFKKVYPIISITVVVFLAVTVLGETYVVASPRIEEQRVLRKERMLKGIFPEMTESTLEDDIYRIYYDGDKIGFAFLAEGRGFGGPITILVGLKDPETVRGIGIVLHTETPGLGAKITEREFLDRFAGLNIADVALTRDDGRIDAITAATVSARAVADTVRKAMEDRLEERE